MADDELQELRDNFYVGNFQRALDLADTVDASNDLVQNERDAIIGRCCLGLSLFDRLKAMQNSECPGQKACALTAVMTKSKQDAQRQAAKERLMTLATDSGDLSVAMLAACALMHDGSWQDALILTQAHPTLEMQALKVIIYIMMNRTDVAEKALQSMAGTNDDAAAFRIASAAVKQATGDPEEAYLIYCDLASQYPPVEGDDAGSVFLLTCKAVANMRRSMWTEAMEDLQRAAALAPNDADVLVNTCVCETHLRLKDDFQQHYAKLEQLYPSHPYVSKMAGIKQSFSRFAAMVKAK